MFKISAKTLFLHLAVSFVLIEKGKTESSNSGFRCTFEDENYKLETNTPIWSTQDTPADKIFTANSVEFKKFRRNVREAMETLINKRPLNNVDQFIRFIKAYKNQTGKSLESFFNDYHVPFQPLEDPVSFLVEINRDLIKNNAGAKDLMYLASAYVDPPESFVKGVLNSRASVNSVDEKSAEAVLTKDRFQRHVAGVINIRYESERGIILLDPGYINGNQRVNPYSVFIMQNSSSDLQGVGLYGEVRTQQIKSNIHLREMFALVTGTPTSTRQVTNVLYLRNKPFCSFMDSTTKGNLLIPNYGIMSFDYKGSPKGYLTFNIVPKKFFGPAPFFRIGTFNESDEEYLGRRVSFFDSIKPVGMKEDIKKEIDNAIRYYFMGLKPEDDLMGKMQTIQTEVFQDQDLVNQIYELTKKLKQNTNETRRTSVRIQKFFLACGTL